MFLPPYEDPMMMMWMKRNLNPNIDDNPEMRSGESIVKTCPLFYHIKDSKTGKIRRVRRHGIIFEDVEGGVEGVTIIVPKDGCRYFMTHEEFDLEMRIGPDDGDGSTLLKK